MAGYLTSREKADIRNRANAGDSNARQFEDQEDTLNTILRTLQTLQAAVGAVAGGVDVGLSGLYNCSAFVNLGDVVYESAANTVDRADATSSLTSPAIGVVTNKLTSTTAIVTYAGTVNVILGLTAGPYYLAASPGQITQTAPTANGQVVQVIGFAKSTTELILTLSPSFAPNSGPIKLYGATSGFIGLQAPAIADSTTYTLPATNGTSGQVLSTIGSGVMAWTTPSSGVVLDMTSGAYGLINTSNTVFTFPSGYRPGSCAFFWDGVMEAPGYVTITETNPGSGIVTLSVPPATGTKLVGIYGAVS